MQWMTDFHVPVIGHDSKKDTVRSPKKDGEEHLGSTARERDKHPPHGKDASQSQGSKVGGVANLQHGQCKEEEVHWGMEGVVSPDCEPSGDISNEASWVQQQEGREYEGHHCLVC